MESLTDHEKVACITARFNALCELVPLRPIHTEAEYDHAVAVLDLLLDAGGADEEHPLAALVNALGTVIGDFENQTTQADEVEVSPADLLRFLMDQHRLGQADLPEVGSQGVVSEVLSGKRNLNVRQIKALSARFHLPPSAFMPHDIMTG